MGEDLLSSINSIKTQCPADDNWEKHFECVNSNESEIKNKINHFKSTIQECKKLSQSLISMYKIYNCSIKYLDNYREFVSVQNNDTKQCLYQQH